jgi:hypothetical protein
MKGPLFRMLKATLEAQRQKALTTLQLLTHHSVGIGDHSTEDYYKNAEEALAMLTDADDKLSTLNNYNFTFSDGEYRIYKDGILQIQ